MQGNMGHKKMLSQKQVLLIPTKAETIGVLFLLVYSFYESWNQLKYKLPTKMHLQNSIFVSKIHTRQKIGKILHTEESSLQQWFSTKTY